MIKEYEIWRDGNRYKRVWIHSYQFPVYVVAIEQRVWADDKIESVELFQTKDKAVAEDWFDRFVELLSGSPAVADSPPKGETP